VSRGSAFSLASLIDKVEPLAAPNMLLRNHCRGLKESLAQSGLFIPLNWPYVEGLRLDEGAEPADILAMGITARPLAQSDGAPVRLVRRGNTVQRHQVDWSALPRNGRKPTACDMEQARARRIRIFNANVNRPSIIHAGAGKKETVSVAAGFRLKRPADAAVQMAYGDEVAKALYAAWI